MLFLALCLFLSLSCGSLISQYILEEGNSQGLQSGHSRCHDSPTQFRPKDQSADSNNDTIGTFVNKWSLNYDLNTPQFPGYLPQLGGSKLFYWCAHH